MKQRIALNSDKSLGFGLLIQHCEKHQQINYHELELGQWWECTVCKKPIVLCTDEGWYEIGNIIQF